jgi:hypothetical protein
MTKSLLYNESLRPRTFPDSGAKVTQLTSSALIHTNIYPEAPVFTPDARYFIYNRLWAKQLLVVRCKDAATTTADRGAERDQPSDGAHRRLDGLPGCANAYGVGRQAFSPGHA